MKDYLSGLKNQKEDLCISMVLPFYQQGKPIEENPAMVRKAIKDVKKILHDKFYHLPGKIQALENNLDELSEKIDYLHRTEGIGLYVSETVMKKFLFEFPVERVMMVDDHFDLRPLLLEKDATIPYALLLLTATKARLYSAMGKKLTEVFQSDFPKERSDNFEYPQPSPNNRESNSVGGSEEKAVTRENRLRTFFASVSQDMKIHDGKNVPLFVSGLPDLISLYKKVSDVTISGILPGNYEYDTLTDLGSKIYNNVLEYSKKNVDDMISKLREAGGPEYASTGIEAVWDEIFKGNARVLLVDKEVVLPAWQTSDKSSVSLARDEKHTLMVADAIGELISLAGSKDCKVMLTAKGALDSFEKIAVLHRYKEEMVI